MHSEESAAVDDLEHFRIRFMRVAGGTMAVVGSLIIVMFLTTGAPKAAIAAVGVGALASFIAVGCAMQGKGMWALNTLIYGMILAVSLFLLGLDEPLFVQVAVQGIYLLAGFSALFGDRRLNLLFGVSALTVLITALAIRLYRFGDMPHILDLGVTDIVHFVILWVVVTMVSGHMTDNQKLLTAKLREMDMFVKRAKRIATGDLSGDVAEGTDVAEVLTEMLDGLRTIVEDVQKSAQVLARASADIDAMSAQQQRGAVQQSSAVSETRETIESFALSAGKIAEAAEGVLENAESTQRTNERANDQLATLTNHTRRINELLEFIKSVASKSEILALNAALEGTRAGDAGKGFSLVAAQMRQLAESTASTIKDVKALTTDITTSTATTVVSMEDAIKLARDTTRAAKQITLTAQQQNSGAEQLLHAMNDIANVTSEFAESTKDALAAISDLKALASRLNDIAHRFTV